MTTITTRVSKGSPLTWSEADSNFNNLNNDKLEVSNNLSDLGDITTAKSNLGLNNVDNTSDINKPISSATQTALNTKQDSSTAVTKDSSTGAAHIPAGTTAQRPGSPSYGDQRANSTLNRQEWWNGSTWIQIADTAGVVTPTGTQTLTNKTLTSPKIKAGQFGDSSTATQNFTLTAEAADGTMKLARGNAGATTQDILIVDASGNVLVDGNNLNLFSAKSLATNGYQKLPSRLIIQWGQASQPSFTNLGTTTVTYPIAFPNAALNMTASGSSTGAIMDLTSTTLSTATVTMLSRDANQPHGAGTFNWIAIGY